MISPLELEEKEPEKGRAAAVNSKKSRTPLSTIDQENFN